MARPKSFDQDKILEQAMHLFWEKGFEATSIQDLVDHLGVNRQSLYDTFGDKKHLFLKCLELYQSKTADEKPSCLDHQGIKQVFQDIFHLIIEESTEDHRGCFMANSTLELASRDEAVASLVCSNLENHEAAFNKLLVEAQEKGELSPDKKPRALARYLFNSIQGLRVTAKASADPARLKDITDITLSVLN